MPAQESKKKSKMLYFTALLVIMIVVSIALVEAISNWSTAEKAKRLKNPIPPTDVAWAAGMSVYLDHCVPCHGDKGDGKGEKADQLSVAPSDFTDARKMNSLVDGQLYWQVTKGRKPMPGFEDKLTTEQRWQVVDYIRSFSQHPASAAPADPGAAKAKQP
ncbi:MAG: c-type cytochrome [Candidatus Acidiferrales bacterium]